MRTVIDVESVPKAVRKFGRTRGAFAANGYYQCSTGHWVIIANNFGWLVDRYGAAIDRHIATHNEDVQSILKFWASHNPQPVELHHAE
ncbi:MAG: hypothetical protein DDT26_00221 [Dehalococcoidia bacterium]|nr:hypothetical protein [Chloroflexota bacterium]